MSLKNVEQTQQKKSDRKQYTLCLRSMNPYEISSQTSDSGVIQAEARAEEVRIPPSPPPAKKPDDLDIAGGALELLII